MRCLLVLSVCASCFLQGCGHDGEPMPVQPVMLDASAQFKPAALPTPSAKPSSCTPNVRLFGVVQSRDRSLSIALVSLDGGSAQPLHKGQDVEPGRTISSISRDAVWLDCGDGTVLEVALQAQPAAGPAGNGAQTVPGPAGAASSFVTARPAARPELIEMAHRDLDAPPSD